MKATKLRRSTRLFQRTSSSQPDSLSSPDDVTLTPSKERSATDPPIQPPKKKAAPRTSKPEGVRMLGKLSGLFGLPIDIFLEITSHLHPLDLLHLSRASRHFARMFLRTDNRHAWLAARRTLVGLPECPSDLTEARYAHLLFESICSGCGKIGRRLLFNLRVRFCASCYKAKVETYLMVDDDDDEDVKTVLQFVPHNYSVTDPSVVEYFEDQLHAIKDEYYKAEAIGAGHVFRAEKQETMLALIEHGTLVRNFLDELQEQKEQEATRLRVARKLQLDARIMALGYTSDEIPEDSVAYQEEIRKTQALTERAWNNMAKKMNRLAASRREEVFSENLCHRLGEWGAIYNDRFRGDWPDSLNASQTDAVEEMLSEANASIPLTLVRFDAHYERILADVAARRDAAQREITDNLTAVYGLPTDAASLYRASAVIRCGECAQVLFAADVMRHLHVCEAAPVYWEDRNWGYDVPLHQVAKGLLHHAGLALDIRSENVHDVEGVLRCGCADMEVPTGFLELVTHLWQEKWSYDETFKLRKPHGGQLYYGKKRKGKKRNSKKRQEALNLLQLLKDDCPSKGEAVVLLELTETLYPRSVEAPLEDNDPCCRLCGEACYMQVDMRSPAQAKWHMQQQHGKIEVLEEYLCPLKDIFRAAQEYVDAHKGQIITTRMARIR